MSENLEEVLRRVAAGELTPEQAIHHLDGDPAPKQAAPKQAAPKQAAPKQAAPKQDEGVTTVRLKTSYRSIQVVTDPTVAQLHVVGDHSIERSGSVLVVSTTGPLDDDERTAGGQRTGAGRFSFNDLPRTIAWARAWREHQLVLRVNPALAVELDVTGADVTLTGLVSGLRARLVASSFKAEKVRCEFDLEAMSSSVKVIAVPTGNSRIYCESSSVRLTLPPAADLTISASNRMSRLVLPDHLSGGQGGSGLPFQGENSELTLGSGRDRLKLEAVMSSVTVSSQTFSEVPR